MAPLASDGARDLLTSVVADAGLVLESVTVTPAGKRRVVRVVVDLPDDATGSLDLDAVADVSRAVSDALDRSSLMGGSPYVLEVSSPGVDRPLTERRHWSRARGRQVTTTLTSSAAELTGRVQSVDDAGVVLEVDGADRRLGWSELGRGLVQVEFSRPGGSADDGSADDGSADDGSADNRVGDLDEEA